MPQTRKPPPCAFRQAHFIRQPVSYSQTAKSLPSIGLLPSHKQWPSQAIGSSQSVQTTQWPSILAQGRASLISKDKPSCPVSSMATPIWTEKHCATFFPPSDLCARSATFRIGSLSLPEASDPASG